MSEYLPALVAVMLVRETVAAENVSDRLAVAGAAHRYAKDRAGTLHDVLRRVAEMNQAPGLRAADARSIAAAEMVERTFNDDMPDVEESAVLGTPDQAGNLICMAVQAVYAEMDGMLRLRFKDALRRCAKAAVPPLDVEIQAMLDLCDSQDAWELEQQLDFGSDEPSGPSDADESEPQEES